MTNRDGYFEENDNNASLTTGLQRPLGLPFFIGTRKNSKLLEIT